MLPEKYIFFHAIFEKNISHKSFEIVEKRGKMRTEIRRFFKPILYPVYFMVLAKNRPAMLPEKQIVSQQEFLLKKSYFCT